MDDYNSNTLLESSGLIQNMSKYLYHGSKQSFKKLIKQKAIAPPGRPPEEALDAIYLTPDFLFALACAARPPGTSNIDLVRRIISFQYPDQFNPDETIYIYFVDPIGIPEEKKIHIDPWQIAVIEDEITPAKIETYKSGDLLKHYKVVDELPKDQDE
ncbi:hypothetical protein C6497_05155 [Candidatus Poribacteria bacterium]|nr:MAG: hypothetical protein C6497_05155 [Candidatus Poribacteria bacterium]